MAQYGKTDIAFAGLKAEHMQKAEIIRTRIAQEIINFGYPVMGYQGEPEKGYNYHLDTAKLVFDGDFVTANVITITVNGEAITPVTFASTHLETAEAVRDAIKALEIDVDGTSVNPDCILDPDDVTNRTFLIRVVGADVTVTEDITGGASQATGTITYSTDQVFIGLARHMAKEVKNSAGARYEVEDSIPVVENGFYWGVMNTGDSALSETDVYLDNAGSDKGVFASTGDAIGAFFRSDSYVNELSDTIAVIELNGIKKINSVIAW